jgi:hypothetical protein
MWLTGSSPEVGVGIQDLYAMRRESIEAGNTHHRTDAQEQLHVNYRPS